MAGAVVPTYYGFKAKNVRREAERLRAPAANAGAMQTGIASGGAATVVITPPSTTADAAGVVIDRIDLGYRTAPTAGSIQASDGTDTWGPFTIVLAGLQTIVFDPPILFGVGLPVTVTLADGTAVKDLYVRSYLEGNSQSA
jgi:hypothetical protein